MPDRGSDPAIGQFTLHRVGPDDWREFREVRRAALADAPEAFASTLADWSDAGDTEERWRQRLTAIPLNLFVELEGSCVAMCSITSPSGGVSEIIGMWVAPSRRGRGLADLLLEAALAWAWRHGAHTASLEVKAENAAAVSAYCRNGFMPDDLTVDCEGSDMRMTRSLVNAR